MEVRRKPPPSSEVAVYTAALEAAVARKSTIGGGCRHARRHQRWRPPPLEHAPAAHAPAVEVAAEQAVGARADEYAAVG
jgi:hypothetical protein